MTQLAVLITGASSGIGASACQQLANQGYYVYAGFRDLQSAQNLRAGIEPVELDVCQPQDWHKVCHQIEKQHAKSFYAVIHNAGVGMGGPIEYLPLRVFREQFEVNFFSVIQGIQTCLPLLRALPSGQKGRIIAISSVNGRIATPFLAPYASSKFALEALIESLSQELRPFGIFCTLIQPGMVKTPIFDKSLQRLQALRHSLPAEALSRYAYAFEAFEKVLLSAGNKGSEPELVAQALGQILGASAPALRYRVGPDAQILLALRKSLPEWMFEKLLQRVGVLRKQD